MFVLEELLEFKRVHGHCKVSQYDKDHKQLGRWVSTQRSDLGSLLHSKKVTDDVRCQINRLTELGFVWSVRSREKSTSNGLLLPPRASNGLKLPAKK